MEELQSKDLVIVPELNFMGQMSAYLRTLGIKAESITQITGLPFKTKDPRAGHNWKGRHPAEGECASMTSKNPEYDFKWCPGCGDFGVRRALEGPSKAACLRPRRRWRTTWSWPASAAPETWSTCSRATSSPTASTGSTGGSLPIAMGVKMARPDLNVVVVAGDGDFLGIGFEHIAPQAARNLNVTAVVMDNGVYGLTKGQSSPND